MLMKYLALVLLLLYATAIFTACQPSATSVNIATPSPTPDPRTEIEAAVKDFLAENPPKECPTLEGLSLQLRDDDIYFVTRDCGGRNIDYLIVQRFALGNKSYWKASLAEKEWLNLLGIQTKTSEK